MDIFAVTYRYPTGADEALAAIRPAHRTFLKGLYDAGQLLASGPTDVPGALLILRAESAQDALALVDGDPFYASELIVDRKAVKWAPVYGPWDN